MRTLQQIREDLGIVVDLIPRGNSNRPGTPLHPSKITIHNTDNDEPGADARAHCRYQKGADAQHRQVSWHFTVDDHSVYQSLPVDEVGWHAGTPAGNANSIGIEICENRGIDQAAANDRAARLTALMLHELGIALAGNVVQHHDWSGKDCPKLLRHPGSGWTSFLQKVADYHGDAGDPGHDNDHAVPAHLEPDATGGLDQILDIAANSAIAHYEWNDRGRAPMAYLKGMALVFGRVYCKWKAKDPAALEMAKADTGDAARDALAHYRQQFDDAGMDNSAAGIATLRHLFVLLTGLGMRESSGKHCEGLYAPDGNTTAETAEAGLFQTSWNARTSSNLLPPLFEKYLADPRGFLEVFEQNVHCKPADAINYGSGPGKEYQRLAKQCPAFAAEFTAVAMRNRRKHWGPMNGKKHEAEIRPECDDMFKQVQAAVDASNLCPLLV